MRTAVEAALVDLRVLLDAASKANVSLRPFVRTNLELQIQGLQALSDHLRTGDLKRRMWSFGQAAVPVLGALINSVAKSANGQLDERLSRCRHSVDGLGEALVQFAEGR